MGCIIYYNTNVKLKNHAVYSGLLAQQPEWCSLVCYFNVFTSKAYFTALKNISHWLFRHCIFTKEHFHSSTSDRELFLVERVETGNGW